MFQKYRITIAFTIALLSIGIPAKAEQLDGLAGAGMFMMAVIAVVLFIMDLPMIKEVKRGRKTFLKIILTILAMVKYSGRTAIYCGCSFYNKR